MSDSRPDRDELFELIDAVCENRLVETQSERLLEILQDDADARRVYVQCLCAQSLLERGYHSKSPSSITNLPRERRSASRRPSLRRVEWSILGACAAAVVAIALVIAVRSGRHSEVHAPELSRNLPTADPPSSVVNFHASVAHLASTVDCQWTSTALACGSSIQPGQKIDLARGRVEIVFDCGVVVELYGPSILEVQSAKKATLLMGHAMARAETVSGHGFVLATRTATTVDLGTEFHVQAAADGHSEIYVTRGAVEVTAGNEKCKRRIEAGQTAQVEPGSAGIIAVIESGDNSPAFKFPTIEPPSDKDYADASQHHAKIVAQGKLSRDSGLANVLLDGHAQSRTDSPKESCFFADDEHGRLLLDLGKSVSIHKINTYSWHAFAGVPAEHDRHDVRATQRYDLYGFVGDQLPPIAGPPADNGWTLISRVNTDEFFSVPPVKNRPVQQGVSIVAAGGDVGKYRFLLWVVKPTHVKALPPHGPENDENTFFGEFDVYAE